MLKSLVMFLRLLAMFGCLAGAYACFHIGADEGKLSALVLSGVLTVGFVKFGIDLLDQFLDFDSGVRQQD